MTPLHHLPVTTRQVLTEYCEERLTELRRQSDAAETANELLRLQGHIREMSRTLTELRPPADSPEFEENVNPYTI